jgi:tetratricopeptide (TPR) repeat protein
MVDSSFEGEISAGRLLARDGDGEASIAFFQEFVKRHPDNPRAHYELACSFDREGREEEAVAPYKKALALGLPEPHLQGLMVGLGSTLRNVGAYDESVDFLTRAVERYPDYADLRVFLAFAKYSAGDHAGALVEALDVILSTPGIDLHGYDRAIKWYTDELRGPNNPPED